MKRGRAITVKTAAEETGFSEWSLRRLISDGELAAFTLPGDRRVWIERQSLEAALERWKSAGVGHITWPAETLERRPNGTFRSPKQRADGSFIDDGDSKGTPDAKRPH